MLMNDSETARLLFFTRAAAEDDPAIAGSRIDMPAMSSFGRAWTQNDDDMAWLSCTDITAPLSIAGIYRLWDDPKTSGHCHRCDSKTLFLRLEGCYDPDCQGRHTSYCPFCGSDIFLRPTIISASLFRSVRRAVERIAAADAETPPGLPFGEALGHLRALRDADLLDPAHPLEVASLERAHAAPPVLTGHKARECKGAQIRAAIASPDLVARVAKERDMALESMSHDKDGADFRVGKAQIDDNAISAAEAELGRSLSRQECKVFIKVLDDYMVFADRSTWQKFKKAGETAPKNHEHP